jgi:hypothetical protein
VLRRCTLARRKWQCQTSLEGLDSIPAADATDGPGIIEMRMVLIVLWVMLLLAMIRIIGIWMITLPSNKGQDFIKRGKDLVLGGVSR